ncbi:fluoride efflux transporter CrcB [Prosthecomicrobium pneumaticum]|uniref:Fluoride-specific ion channel FluC n=1 Tax=Prosthecomicrobium pneumaticum TaxID=81895 RepID=A0A7W9FNZ3_9HYPH|nr:fluoride efflux transporter CrcB [Prosthecomicrobium pneumaticum]MBB5754212.1 CrcB protein [Prosthecomicrobium pneumaticum]
MPFLIVFLGAGIGGAARHGVNTLAMRLAGPDFPFGTMVINLLGCFLMGLLAGWLALKAGEGWTQGARLFLATGVLGGFTTFSAFSLDVAVLLERGAAPSAILYVLVSVLGAIAAVFLGLALVRTLA